LLDKAGDGDRQTLWVEGEDADGGPSGDCGCERSVLMEVGRDGYEP